MAVTSSSTWRLPARPPASPHTQNFKSGTSWQAPLMAKAPDPRQDPSKDPRPVAAAASHLPFSRFTLNHLLPSIPNQTFLSQRILILQLQYFLPSKSHRVHGSASTHRTLCSEYIAFVCHRRISITPGEFHLFNTTAIQTSPRGPGLPPFPFPFSEPNASCLVPQNHPERARWLVVCSVSRNLFKDGNFNSSFPPGSLCASVGQAASMSHTNTIIVAEYKLHSSPFNPSLSPLPRFCSAIAQRSPYTRLPFGLFADYLLLAFTPTQLTRQSQILNL